LLIFFSLFNLCKNYSNFESSRPRYYVAPLFYSGPYPNLRLVDQRELKQTILWFTVGISISSFSGFLIVISGYFYYLAFISFGWILHFSIIIGNKES